MGSWVWLSAEAREAKISCLLFMPRAFVDGMAWGSRASEGRLLQGSGAAGVSALK